MITPDALPVWFAVPAALVVLVWWLVLEFRGSSADPVDEDTGLDVYEKTGVHPHG